MKNLIYTKILIILKYYQKMIFLFIRFGFFKIKDSIFSVFQGHHINLDYLKADLIFPSITF